MPDIAEAIKKYQKEIESHGARLVAISKTKPTSDIEKAMEAGQLDFGENKVQEIVDKYEKLPKEVRWHMVGHLQRNKVKYIAPFIHLIHSVDSPRLLKEINKQGKKAERSIQVLLQVHIAREESKYGFDEGELLELLESEAFTEYQHIRIIGLMGMATFTDNTDVVASEFEDLKNIFDRLKSKFDYPNMEMTELSMGMSGDYKVALEKGSTMVRIGSSIFGERNYG